MTSSGNAPARAKPPGQYHHGDLRQALALAGLRLAREGGPDAVVLRAATREVGVSANAAYRHFADRAALLEVVVGLAQARAAVAMEAELDTLDPVNPVNPVEAEGRPLDPAAHARARLRAVGAGYLRFAQTEPGLFRTAFSAPTELGRIGDAASAGASGRTPYQLLSAALDGLAATGQLSPARREGAELVAWSAVHGLAMLTIAGPLRSLPPTDVDRVGQAVLAMVEQGLTREVR